MHSAETSHPRHQERSGWPHPLPPISLPAMRTGTLPLSDICERSLESAFTRPPLSCIAPGRREPNSGPTCRKYIGSCSLPPLCPYSMRPGYHALRRLLAASTVIRSDSQADDGKGHSLRAPILSISRWAMMKKDSRPLKN